MPRVGVHAAVVVGMVVFSRSLKRPCNTTARPCGWRGWNFSDSMSLLTAQQLQKLCEPLLEDVCPPVTVAAIHLLRHPKTLGPEP